MKRIKPYLILLLFLPLLALFFPSAVLMDGWQTGPFFYFCLATAVIFLTLSVAGMVSRRAISIRMNGVDIALMLFLAWCTFRTGFNEQSYFLDMYFIQWMLLEGLYWIWKQVFRTLSRDEDPPFFQADVLFMFFLSIVLAEAFYGLGQLYGFYSSGSIFRVTGHFVNPDHYAGYIASAIPFAFGLFCSQRDGGHLVNKLLLYCSVLTFVICLMALSGTLIRSAWIAAAAGTSFVWLHNHRQYKGAILPRSSFRRGLVFALVLFVAGVAASGLYHMKPDSADGRLLIWKISGQTIKEAPFFGHGFNTYRVNHNRAQATYFMENEATKQEVMVAGNVEHAHNEYLQITSELGLAGLLLFGLVIFFANRPQGAVHDILKNRMLLISARGSLIAILVSALFSFPFHILPTFIHFFFFLALISSLSGTDSERVVQLSERVITSCCILILAASVWFLWLLNGQYKGYKAWNEANQTAQMGLFEVSVDSYEQVYPDLQWNGKFLFTSGGTLAAAERYEEALTILERSKKVYSDPNLFLALGETRHGLGDLEGAAEHFKIAWHIIPHRMYPLYRLVLLKQEAGKQDEAVFWAETILKMEEKIPSAATQQMKEEMQVFLESRQYEISF